MPPAATADAILQQLNWRYATKKFDPARKIDAGTWSKLEQTLVLAPSSFGLQLWKFVVVNDPAVRQKLKAVSWNQSQVTDASHLIVVCAKSAVGEPDVLRLVDRVAAVRKVPVESLAGYRDMMLGFIKNPSPGWNARNWTDRQAYIAVGFFLEAAAMLGIDACPMEGIDAAGYDQVLGLEKMGYHALCIVTAGYRAADDAYASLPKVRFAAEEVIKHV